MGRIRPIYLRQLCEFGLSPGRARQVRLKKASEGDDLEVGDGADG
jgi:hypothetical protein